jgi:hypothetical protein
LASYRASLQNPALNPYKENMVNLTGLFGYGSPLVWPATFAAALLCWRLIGTAPLEASLAAAS